MHIPVQKQRHVPVHVPVERPVEVEYWVGWEDFWKKYNQSDIHEKLFGIWEPLYAIYGGFLSHGGNPQIIH